MGKNCGLSLVTLYMDLLKSLLRKGDDTELRGQPEQKNTQIEPELFMEAEILIQDSENEKVLIFLCRYCAFTWTISMREGFFVA